MLNNIRRKVANAITPAEDKYVYIEKLNSMTAERENTHIINKHHKEYYDTFGKVGTNEEVWKWGRERVNKLLRDCGLEPANDNTDFNPNHFILDEIKKPTV